MRISTTQLEAFRRWRSIESAPVEELEETIRGDLIQTPAMVRGGALHDVVAYPGRYLASWTDAKGSTGGSCYSHYDRDGRKTGWHFAIQPIDDLRKAIGSQVVELKTEMEIDGHTVVAKADGLQGSIIDEIKVRGKSHFEPEWFVDSFQWRIYLMLFKATEVRYHLVTLDEPRKGEVLTFVKEHQVLGGLCPYPALEAEVRQLIRDFAGFVRERGMEGYLGEVGE